MKRALIFLISSLLLSYTGHGQDEEIVKLSDIVAVEGYSANLLFHNASNYLNKPKKVKKKKKKNPEIQTVKNEENTWVSTPKDIAVYSGQITKHTLGHIKFEYRVEVKDGKYRYTFSDMKFIPYSRNRYGKFEAVPAKSTSIQAIINNPKYRYRNEILKFVNNYTIEEAARLQYKMIEIERAENDNNPPQEEW